MNCEEFANEALDRDLEAAGQESATAREHLRVCANCAALYETARALREDLGELGRETSGTSAPSRVEMRLRQEFRTLHRTEKVRGRTMVAGWALAAAAVIAGAVVWVNWRGGNKVQVAESKGPAVQVAAGVNPPGTTVNPSSEAGMEKSSASPVATLPAQTARKERARTGVVPKASGEFTLLPDSVPGFLDDSTVVRVQLQRGALGAFGLPVSEERASEWIQVDLLVAADGQPQAVRLPQSTNN